MTANERQVGGNHYRSTIQHWDFVTYHGIGYLEGCLTKYISRHHKKNGLQDLEKAEHYLEKLIEYYKGGNRSRIHWHTPITKHTIRDFVTANELGELEGKICELIFKNYTLVDLYEARMLLQNLIKKVKEPRVDATGMEYPFGYEPI